MGSGCSNIEKDDAPGEKDGQGQRGNSNTLTRHSSWRLQKQHQHQHQHHYRHLPASPIADVLLRQQTEMDMAQEMIDAHDKVIDLHGHGLPPRRRVATILDDGRRRTRSDTTTAEIKSVDDYMRQRDEITRRESTLSFDFRLTVRASQKERKANLILQALKAEDQSLVYDAAEPRLGWGGQSHPRIPADHFLSNVDLINKTKLFKVARRLPKGAHLHIHYNACLEPTRLLGVAKGMDRMFITSDLPLPPAGRDGVTKEDAKVALDRCEIQFSILSEEKEKPGNIFSPTYEKRQTMKYSDFLTEFLQAHGQDPEAWLASKSVFQEGETYHPYQTVHGAWEKFNGRTRMMKGLFNYEEAYRQYTREVLQDFVDDNIQYAEIRPNFMENNQLWSNDGKRLINNEGIMEIIIEEYHKFKDSKKKSAEQHEFQASKKNSEYFGGLKVIYCTPRSFPNKSVEFALDECLKFKKKWPQWIAGFDLVGEESKGRPLRDFVPELLAFKKRCADEKLDIPFLFHCGETNDIGNDTDGNLVDALLLESKRIGHGFALARHPYIMEHMKKKGICLEVCPISNEILGLTPRITGHSMYNLLANNVHCTLNSDNGTIFRSTLSHDFYQSMIGKTDMTLHGWRQLIEWSLEHSCMSPSELKDVRAKWETLWEEFLDWVITEYKSYEPAVEDGPAARS
ncbi:adenosine/AMP deaminase [Colletotrichum sojae]|uniref:adenosine deaminase n=1 Tax=Colletotrichum sojae TaxID=2175907 RepID=A0A8H6N3U1_9PEZI|nr:adenosine/AMP deaminase [Colletotrichum sojae]